MNHKLSMKIKMLLFFIWSILLAEFHWGRLFKARHLFEFRHYQKKEIEFSKCIHYLSYLFLDVVTFSLTENIFLFSFFFKADWVFIQVHLRERKKWFNWKAELSDIPSTARFLGNVSPSSKCKNPFEMHATVMQSIDARMRCAFRISTRIKL